MSIVVKDPKASRRDYRLADGTRLPGTTTITGRFKQAEGLIYWAWKQGCDGLDYRDIRDKAANAGTLAHDMIEADIQGEFIEVVEREDETYMLARRGYEGYKRWAEQSHLKIIDTEIKLVSEEYRYGGTPDAIGMLGDVLVLLDWKTGKRLYPEALLQLAAYRQLLGENGHGWVQEFHLIRFGKEDASYHHHSWQDLSKAWDAFKLMRELYELDKTLKAAV
jgi:predicted RecB family nuclease